MCLQRVDVAVFKTSEALRKEPPGAAWRAMEKDPRVPLVPGASR